MAGNVVSSRMVKAARLSSSNLKTLSIKKV